ncbi:MAG TPA: DUF192 domain-containing protein [Steroidobacteraceae bacterium]|nr:DUF192 domain-containing protein [Steroidobacteraceae bacterium]
MKRLAACLAMLLMMPAWTQATRDFQPAQLRDFPTDTLEIERTGGRDRLNIWVADTEARQEQGLMWIRSMPADYGMLFPLEPPRTMYMWMKNTYLSLDMLFYDAAGRITHIQQHAKPLSEEIISSGGVVAGVVEMLGGEVARRGIRVGDRVVIHGRGS